MQSTNVQVRVPKLQLGRFVLTEHLVVQTALLDLLLT